MQWSLLPPLMMTTPQVAVAGVLEPAYAVAGDSFDYALNDDVLHLAIIDAMGHGLEAAVLATATRGEPTWTCRTSMRPWTRPSPDSSMRTGSSLRRWRAWTSAPVSCSGSTQDIRGRC